MIIKTLTFGLGEIKGFNIKNKELFQLDDDKKKNIYTEIIKSFRDFARLCNYTTALLYTNKILKVPPERMGYNKGYKPIYKNFKFESHLSSKIRNQAWGIAKSHFSGEHGIDLMVKGETVLPTHRSDGTHPIYFHQDAVKLHYENNCFYIIFNIFEKDWAKKENLPSWIAFRINLKKRDKTGGQQLQNVTENVWQKGSAQLVRNKRKNGTKYLMHIAVKYTPSPYKYLSKNTVMGIDLGVNVPAAIHIRIDNEPQKWARCIGNGRMMLNARNVYRIEIKRLLQGLKNKDSPIEGPSREAALNKLRDLRKKEKRVMKTASQKIASAIAEQAKRNGAGTWQLEDLSLLSLKDGKPWLTRNWAPGMLIDAIKWQADQMGVDFITIPPQYTSQRCSCCGYINSDNRPKKQKGAAFFECTNSLCGYKDHADKNAARNLSTIGIDTIILSKIKIDDTTP